MAIVFGPRPRVSEAGRAALAKILAAPTFELLPLKNAFEQASYLPAGSTISITASPAKGIEATLALADKLRAAGYHAVPHLSARMIRDRAHLTEIVAWLRSAGVSRAFVVGGDAKDPGAYSDGLSLLRDLAEIGHPLSEIGVPCYPEGHAFISNPDLLEALREKAKFATYMTTQMCFDPKAIEVWLWSRRAEDIALPVHIGVPGPAEAHRLLAISARIGVADTGRFVSKNVSFVARLLRSGGFYKPNGLLEGLAPLIADPAAGVADLHVYTFNAVDATDKWRREYLQVLPTR
jgi:methylenetetrahydrofolate reductase (NADPH)